MRLNLPERFPHLCGVDSVREEWLTLASMSPGGGASMEAVRPWILAPISSPPKGSADRGRIICNCFDVALSEIEADAVEGMSLDQIQDVRKCGTSCGSCLPEVKRIVATRGREHATA